MSIEYNLEIITPPTVELVKLKKAKEQVRVEADETYDDNFLSDLLEEAIELVEDQADITFHPKTYRLTLPRFPRRSCDVIKLPRSPLIVVDSIEYFDANNDLQELDTVEVSTGDLSSISIDLYTSWPTTRRRRKAVTIEYQSGSDKPPKRARRAVLLLVGLWYHDREGERQIPPAVQSIIEQLRPGDDFDHPLSDSES